MDVADGYKYCFGFGSYDSFTDALNKGDKLGVLVDMFEGGIKFFVNNEDKGWAVENEKRLTEIPLFVTVCAYGIGTIRVVPSPSSQYQVRVPSPFTQLHEGS